MLTRTCCAALDHNCNSDRQQAKTAAGAPRFDLVKQRHGRKYFVKAVKEEKDHSWRNKILHLIFEVSDDLVNNYICTYLTFCSALNLGRNLMCLYPFLTMCHL